MKCPLSKEVRYEEGYYTSGEFKDCLEEGCAWWDFDQKLCSVRSFQMDVARIRHWLQVKE